MGQELENEVDALLADRTVRAAKLNKEIAEKKAKDTDFLTQFGILKDSVIRQEFDRQKAQLASKDVRCAIYEIEKGVVNVTGEQGPTIALVFSPPLGGYNLNNVVHVAYMGDRITQRVLCFLRSLPTGLGRGPGLPSVLTLEEVTIERVREHVNLVLKRALPHL